MSRSAAVSSSPGSALVALESTFAALVVLVVIVDGRLSSLLGGTSGTSGTRGRKMVNNYSTCQIGVVIFTISAHGIHSTTVYTKRWKRCNGVEN